MNKEMQDGNIMQDEELYALLDKALCTERLTVSEALIQKTLQRVGEAEETKVISFEKAKKKKVSPVAYAGVAAAALILVLGVRTVNGGKFTAEDAQLKSRDMAAPEIAAESEQSSHGLLTDAVNDGAYEATENGFHYYSSTADSDFERGSAPSEMMPAAEAEEKAAEAGAKGGTGAMTGITVTVAEELTGLLTDAGLTPSTRGAEYWEFATPQKSWEKELGYALRACTVEKTELPESGSYGYALECKDGGRKNIQCNEPLDAVVRLETERGVLWGLLGESCSFYLE